MDLCTKEITVRVFIRQTDPYKEDEWMNVEITEDAITLDELPLTWSEIYRYLRSKQRS